MHPPRDSWTPSSTLRPGRLRFSQADVLVLAGCSVAQGVIFTSVILRQSTSSDFPFHAELAQQWLGTGRPPVPHAAYHALSLLLHALVPTLSVLSAGRVIAISAYVLSGLIAYALIRPYIGRPGDYRGALLAACGVLSLQILAPVSLLTQWQHNLYIGYIPTIVYHNPTIVLLRPLALLLFLNALKAFDRDRINGPWSILGAVALVMVSTLAKPSYAICLLPGLLLVSAVRHLWHASVDWRFVLLGFALPLLLLLGVQYVATYGAGHAAGIEFAPLYFFQETLRQLRKPVWLAPKFVLSILFPFSVVGLHWRTALRSVPLMLAWVVFVIGALYGYLVIESGPGRLDGNFTWSGQIALYVLFVVSLVFSLQQASRKVVGANIACAIALALHVLSGVVWAWTQAGRDAASWW